MINVGITEYHGIAKEYTKHPPTGVNYSPVHVHTALTSKIFRTPAKGVYGIVKESDHDIIEAPLFPILTKKPWIYTPARFSSAGTFDFFGMPTPRAVKMAFVEQILSKKNFKKLLFKSHYGLSTLKTYGRISNQLILDKADVVYPIVRKVSDDKIFYNDEVTNLLFVGEFLRKGGANVVDVFLELKKTFPNLKLTCCSPSIKESDGKLGIKYKKIIENHHHDIHYSYVDREVIMSDLLPNADVYLCPTYQEAWGFSIQEAMAYGRPIIATDISAIPEMIEHNKSGILLNIKDHEYILKAKGYILGNIPNDFTTNLNEQLYQSLFSLIKDKENRIRLGKNALATARSKFSIEQRNLKMENIYRQALNG